MKATGIVRKMDELGRMVIPMELRKTLNINIGDPLEIYTAENAIIFKPFSVGCIFCKEAETEKLTEFKGKTVCTNCIENIK